ncbi:MAG TPA: heavy metal translocating P-type ATPase, partial [Longimicrobiales bacterium]|nr:heavy metal translocating P-type ATPase [Longimicrobiales bacterium]
DSTPPGTDQHGSVILKSEQLPDAPAATTCTFAVDGMDCSSCAETIEKSLRRLDGVDGVRVDVMGGRVEVAYAGDSLAPDDLARAITRAGYGVSGRGGAVGASAHTGTGASDEARGWWARRGQLVLAVVSGVLWASSLAAKHLADMESAAAVLAVGAMVAGGWYIVPRGVRAALNRSLDMNFLMSIAALGALVIGEYEEAASALFLFAVAQLLEAYSMDRARNAIRSLMELSPAEATVLRGGREERIPADQVLVGERVVVRPGEKIAVDGEVVAGISTVDQAPITGESVPVEKEPGSEVFAGTLNGAGALEVRSSRPASDTTLARIIHSVSEAQASRAPSQTFVDRFARVYTPIVVAVALAVFVLPPVLGAGTWADWFYRALVLLVVACPCALVISTPVTVVSALAGAARRGILIKGGLHLENAGRATIVALDKTGTLTEGRPQVVEVVAFDGASTTAVLELAAAAESRSEHPLAHAVIRYAAEQGVAPAPASTTSASVGRGVIATVDGKTAYIGSERFFRELGPLDAAVVDVLTRFNASGSTAILVGVAPDADVPPRITGAIALADRIRAHAPAALRAMHDAGIERVVMLTGDSDTTAQAVAGALGRPGIDEVRAGLLPDGKVAAIRELRSAGFRVLMVGDGVNDAPALAAADVGIAMGSAGTDVALETADIALMADDLSKLPEMVRFARKAEGIIRMNIAFALLTKAAFVVLAVAGVATLWMAVLADMGASLIVIANGLRALRA